MNMKRHSAEAAGTSISSLKGNIYLVGMMGAGKTSVGKLLAKRAKKEFFDSDQVIVERTGVEIPTIFHHEGEDGFREREKAVIFELTQMENIVLATGGGAVLREENRQHLISSGFVIYLKAQVDALYKRTQLDKSRPLLQTDDPRARLDSLFQERDPIYSEVADLIIETGDLSLQGFLRRLERAILEKIK
ncbi:MAG: shikimate kinase [Betaproteobacteria bacterium]|jgi:shikimate kinase